MIVKSLDFSESKVLGEACMGAFFKVKVIVVVIVLFLQLDNLTAYKVHDRLNLCWIILPHMNLIWHLAHL